jgi:hypothetical protein
MQEADTDFLEYQGSKRQNKLYNDLFKFMFILDSYVECRTMQNKSIEARSKKG